MIGLVSLLFQGNYVACLIAMLQLMDEKHYQKYVQHFPSDQDLMVSLYPAKINIQLQGNPGVRITAKYGHLIGLK